MILSQDPALARGQPVCARRSARVAPAGLAAPRRAARSTTTSELEAAGSALEDVRRTVADVVVAARRRALAGVRRRARRGVRRRRRARGRRRSARPASAVEIREILRGRDVRGAARRSEPGGCSSRAHARARRRGRWAARGVRSATRRPTRSSSPRSPPASAATRSSSTPTAVSSASSRGPPAVARPVSPRWSGARRSSRASASGVRPRGRDRASPAHAVVVGRGGDRQEPPRRGVRRTTSTAVVLDAACTPYGEGITFLPLRELAEHAAALDESAPALGELESADAALAAARTLLEHFAAQGPLVGRARRPALGRADLPRPRRVRRPRGRRAPARRLGDAARAPRAAPRLGRRARRYSTRSAATTRGSSSTRSRSARRSTTSSRPRSSRRPRASRSSSSSSPRTRRRPTSRTSAIPMTLDALLASRIDVLEPGERAVLSRAAVVGRAFSRESLGALTPDAEARELDGRLASLERRRLVRPRGDDHEFVHPLVRGAAYDAIGRPERAAMHETFRPLARSSAARATSSSGRTSSVPRLDAQRPVGPRGTRARRIGASRGRRRTRAPVLRPRGGCEPARARGGAPRRGGAGADRDRVQSRARAEGARAARSARSSSSKHRGPCARRGSPNDRASRPRRARRAAR